MNNTEYDDCEIIYISNERGEMQEILQINEVNVKREEPDHSADINYKDFSEVCRTCLFRGELMPIFNSKISEDSNLTIDQLIKDCIAMNVEETDDLPQNICLMCVQRLMKIYYFRKHCLINEAMFKLILLNYEGEPEKKVGDLLKKMKTEPQIQSVEEDAYQSTYESHSDSHQQGDNDEDEDLSSDECSEDNDMMKFSDQDDDMKFCSDEIVHENQSFEAALPAQEATETAEIDNDTEKRIDITNVKKEDGKREYQCTQCSMTFKSRDDYMIHRVEMKHSSHRVSPCSVCSKLFSSAKMKQHMRTHTKEKPYECEACPKKFSLQSNLRRHKMRHTGERPHICEKCGKGFIQLASLQKHRETHRGQQSFEPGHFNFTCDICGRGFKRLKPYDLHMQRHNPEFLKREATEQIQKSLEKPYGCDICGKHFNTHHHLKTHKLIHGERRYLCNECGKGFVTKAALQSHLKIHTGEKPYTCSVCQKSFAHVGTFESHTLIHAGLRPFACQECGKTFTQWSHLMYHQRTHSGERPYICSYCGKSFALNGNLTVHVRTHTGETPYSCEICGKGFYDSSSRNKHQRGHDNTDKRISRAVKKETSIDASDNKFEIDFKPFNRSLFKINKFEKSEQCEANVEQEFKII